MPALPEDEQTADLITRAAGGDQTAWAALLNSYRGRLRRMVSLRMDRRLQGRIDPSDVIQEASLDAAQRLSEYLSNPSMPFFLWLRLLTVQRLTEKHRVHLKAKARDVGREIRLHHGAMPQSSSTVLAAQLLGHFTSASEAYLRAERRIRMEEALNSMDAIDREILALRHYEQMSNSEVAGVLGLDKSTASKRYGRALVRLKEILSSLPGGFKEV